MLDDEGHATELLRSARLTLSDDHRDGGEPFSAGRLLRSARQLTGAGEETSSLHLLVALIQSDDLLAIRLADHGLSEDTIREQFPTGNAPPGASISTDIRIAPAAAAVDDLSATWRILDAAANRAREGLRVLEDHARFGLDDAHLTERLKQVRHRLAELLQTLLGDRAIRLRNTPGDVGTAVHTRFEASRDTERDIVRANACRVQEALRTLEEYSKRIDSFSAAQIGQLRYESYPLEQALLTAQMARGRLGGVSLCLLATDALCPQGVGPVVLAALEAGCPMVQLREKSVPDDQLLLRAKLLREWTRETGALLIINDRPDLAVLVDADGVHVGQEDLPVAAVRRIVGSDRLVGVSTHNLAQVRKAVDDGADYLGVGPVFPSSTKSFDNFVGLEFVQAAVQETSLPCFAIGGVDAANVSQVAASGCRRVAVSGAICSASDPSAATRKLLDQLEAPQKSD
ncbi:MAG: thiamine phosphate synthase [Planctomycetaceae bacterium]|nr:thiamine phosphate synthase [Planctomycetaceae bacterium]